MMDALPILTVMPDFGSGPFLWINREGDPCKGVGGGCCDATCRCSNHPMSDDLFEAFRKWIGEFESAPWTEGSFVYPEDPESGWHKKPELILNWSEFHAHGLDLTRRLKAEVGTGFQVIYEKPSEDHHYRDEERREVLNDGSVIVLPNRCELLMSPLRNLVCKFVSGGQTGVDRAALDWAMENEYEVGGWCPKGRRAEDGAIDERYPLVETDSDNYRNRTRLNVGNSDGTLIVNLGELKGGSLLTRRIAEQMGKHCLVVQLDSGISPEIVMSVLAWLRKHHLDTLNIAGPRESGRAGIYRLTRELLDAVETVSREEWRQRHEDNGKVPPR